MKKTKEKVEPTPTELRQEELAPIAHELAIMIASEKLQLGEPTEGGFERYNQVAGKVLDYMLVNNVRYTDRNYILQTVLQSFQQTFEIVLVSMENSYNKAMEITLGEDMETLRMKHLDDILKPKVDNVS